MGSPEALVKNRVYGSLNSAFRTGYEGKPMRVSYRRNTPVYAAYWAGRDSAGITDSKKYPTDFKTWLSKKI